ncbi:MAG: eukaryotic-like serine/threonine-protein kinase [Cyanobacteriota bacterium erpe_2018_sw_21hr_WHONDRS-SW48-000092_B_bin.40]|jgi:tRNA A-37 threonylcarbamoyl transferase component Bud32|nr:eukaryotic-like serine/threonine-protein kinase [Cyanobacteriota bacterium erpe_2018_sw_21hr_WHONDRS-SW48-000092_B_bin.40]
MNNQANISKLNYHPASVEKVVALRTITLVGLIVCTIAMLILTVMIFFYGLGLSGGAGAKFIALDLLVFSLATFSLWSKVGKIRDSYLAQIQPLIITSGGAIFPFATILQLKGRRWRRWEELKNAFIYWNDGPDFEDSDVLVLTFKDGSSARIVLKTMLHQDIEKLLVALEMWAPPSAISENFVDLRGYLSQALHKQGLKSYTALWNDELSRRFSLATFRPLPAGTKLQNRRFEITSQLGFGGFSAVYNALNSRGEQVVIKELAIKQLDSEAVKTSLIEHMSRETALLAKIQHPQVCRLLDTFVENDRHYIVLEKIPGSTLRQVIIDNGPMKEAEVKALALQMAEILSYLHTQQPPMVHRDFTPDNLIIRSNKFLALVDFNAAMEFLAGATGTIIGRHHYMPPEQIQGKAVVASDYYSMAGTIYFLLTGQDPRPLTQLDVRAEGIPISGNLNHLLFALTSSDISERPSVQQIISSLQSV